MPKLPVPREWLERSRSTGCGFNFRRRKGDDRFRAEFEEVETLRCDLQHVNEELYQLQKDSDKEHHVQALEIELQRVSTARWEEEACTAELKGLRKAENLVHGELQELQRAANEWKQHKHPLQGEASTIMALLHGDRASVNKAVFRLNDCIHALDQERFRLVGLMEQEASCSSRSSIELAACAGQAIQLHQEQHAVAQRSEQIGRTQVRLNAEQEQAHSAYISSEESAEHLERLLEGKAMELDEIHIRFAALERQCAGLENEQQCLSHSSKASAVPDVDATRSATEALQEALNTEHLSCERLREEVLQWCGCCTKLEILVSQQEERHEELQDEQRVSGAKAQDAEVSQRKLLAEVAQLHEAHSISQHQEAEGHHALLQMEIEKFHGESLEFQHQEAELQAALHVAMIKCTESNVDKVELRECLAHNELLREQEISTQRQLREQDNSMQRQLADLRLELVQVPVLREQENSTQRQLADLRLELVKRERLEEQRCTAEALGAKQRQVMQNRAEVLEQNRLTLARRLDAEAIVHADLRAEVTSLRQELWAVKEEAQRPPALKLASFQCLPHGSEPVMDHQGHLEANLKISSLEKETTVMRTQLEALESERPELMGRLAGAENSVKVSKAEANKTYQLLSDERLEVKSLEMRCQELLEEHSVSLQLTAGQKGEISALRKRLESSENARRSETAKLRSELEMEARRCRKISEPAASLQTKVIANYPRANFHSELTIDPKAASDKAMQEAESLWSDYSKRMAELQNLCSSGSRPESLDSPMSLKQGTLTPVSTTANLSPGTTPAITPRDHTTWTPIGASCRTLVGDDLAKTNRTSFDMNRATNRSRSSETTASSADGSGRSVRSLRGSV